jgi:hypothetical protein
MRKIESFSSPCPAPASQSLPITPTSPAATITKKRKKRVAEATKIHPNRHSTKPLSTNRRSAHPSCRSRRHRSQQRRQHYKGLHCNNLLSPCSQRIRKQRHKPMSPSLQLVLPTNKTKASPSYEDLHYSVPAFILYCGASELKQRRAFVWLRKRKRKYGHNFLVFPLRIREKLVGGNDVILIYKDYIFI